MIAIILRNLNMDEASRSQLIYMASIRFSYTSILHWCPHCGRPNVKGPFQATRMNTSPPYLSQSSGNNGIHRYSLLNSGDMVPAVH